MLKIWLKLGGGERERGRKNVVRKGRSLRASIIVEKISKKRKYKLSRGSMSPDLHLVIYRQHQLDPTIYFFANIVDPSLQLRPTVNQGIITHFFHAILSDIFKFSLISFILPYQSRGVGLCRLRCVYF